ncbi:UNVERIFIED_CONTAM: hypothetical protein FKN15_005259 [Acipenser sinensis]
MSQCAPPGSQFFQVKCTNAVQYQISPKDSSTSNNMLPLEKSLSLSITMMAPSKDASDNKGSWKWGPNGHGAIVLVNCDMESLVGTKRDCDDDSLSFLSGMGFPDTPIFTDKVVFHMAPWIMTPNTLRPLQVFVCSTTDNYSFLKDMKELVKESGCKLKVCHEYMNRGDRWMQQRTVRLECGKATHVLHVLGTQLNVKLYRCAPPGSQFFQVKCTNAVQYQISPKDSSTSNNMLPLEKSLSLSITMMAPSKDASDNKVAVSYFGDNLEELGKAILHLTSVELSLDVDADRDGVVEKNNPNKGSWKWGPNGHGAIVLVNCDMESLVGTKRDCDDDSLSFLSDLKDMSRMVLRTNGPGQLPPGYKLVLHISLSDADKIGVFQIGKSVLNKSYPVVLGRKTLSYVVKYEGGTAETEFFVEGRKFLDENFEGLVTIYLSLLEPSTKGFPDTPIFTDKVVFHMAPWIMTPNTLRPLQVFVCSTTDNYSFLKDMKELVKESGCKLKVCHEYMNRGDRWMQDELEFGYVEAPHQCFPVVLDSPRDGDLKNFPYNELLGPDFGYVTRVALNEKVTSLDSFGNLEVSPPVTVNGKEYPLGRIIIGCAFPTTVKGRNMTKVVQDFLWAQKVQAPIAVFSDWLSVGHVDEFMTFVPAPNRKGFRLLLASPDAGYEFFRGLQKKGHGKAKMFEGTFRKQPIEMHLAGWDVNIGFRLLLASPDAGYEFFRGLQKKGHGKAKMFEGLKDDEVTVDQILSSKQFQQENAFVQSCIDWNRDVLKKELGLEEEDIIDLPILFSLKRDKRAVAYYPDMVNMIVLGKNLGIPKPYGPKIDGVCALEKEVCSLLGGLGLDFFFIDDFASYHKLEGEVHCGSNVQRDQFSYKWWNMAL